MNYEKLKHAVSTQSMLRITTTLAPLSEGGLVYPPTYPNPDSNDRKQKSVHVFRDAWIKGELKRVVVLDSPQSQANRIEDAILDALQRGKLSYPDVEVQVQRSDGVSETYSVLQLSHRVFDAVLLACELDGLPFKKTEIGQAVYGAALNNAAGLFTHAPITLALGGWDSHSGGGPLSVKIPRILTSEIIGVDAKVADRGATKFDPMDIRKGPTLYKARDPEKHWVLDSKQAAEKTKKDPSDFGFGSVPAYDKERGASIRYALQNTHISLPAVRRQAFPSSDGKRDDERDLAGRTAVVALALYGLCLQRESGYFLRSGCDLIPKSDAEFEIIGRSLAEVERTQLDSDTARVLLDAALDEARSHGLSWRSGTTRFDANDDLRSLVDSSRADRSPEQS